MGGTQKLGLTVHITGRLGDVTLIQSEELLHQDMFPTSGFSIKICSEETYPLKMLEKAR